MRAKDNSMPLELSAGVKTLQRQPEPGLAGGYGNFLRKEYASEAD